MFEAELERLGLNRSTSTLERRLTDLDELPNSVHQVSEDYIWESSVLYRPMFTSEEVEILGLNQFLLAIRHALMHTFGQKPCCFFTIKVLISLSVLAAITSVTRTYPVAPNGHRTQGLGSLEMRALAVNNRLLMFMFHQSVLKSHLLAQATGPSRHLIPQDITKHFCYLYMENSFG
ncbi:hypothetical protein ABKV19_026841 [Rosa sericea]